MDIKKTMGYLFEQTVKASPDKPAIICGDEIVTFKEINERVNQLANALVDLGLKEEIGYFLEPTTLTN